MSVHGSCAAFGDDAILLLGSPGSGKSDLLLRLLDRGFSLVGDDQLVIENTRIRAATPLSGLLEVRGVGIFQVPCQASAHLRLIVTLGIEAVRLPAPVADPALNIATLTVDPRAPSAAIKIAWALDAICGRKTQYCGAFAA
ncbi:aldolase [Acidiphilium sp. PA]|uniref:HPr kinase/phosphorylase n=1 Tax=Acidiphilium sp. PA TaxID=2871705 RepID=UPI0022436972|nr:aldolase [Acidiphilium sp. PA]MCW8306515.1 aldolase [Acidiphilium sp. PA]